MKMMVICPKCGKGYDLIKETKKATGKDILCPHCKAVVGRK